MLRPGGARGLDGTRLARVSGDAPKTDAFERVKGTTGPRERGCSEADHDAAAREVDWPA